MLTDNEEGRNSWIGKMYQEQFPLVLTGFYILVGGLWILFSDQLLWAVSPNPEMYSRWQTYKGWFFVLFTGAALYRLIQVYVARQRRAEQRLHRSEESLRSVFDSAGDAVFLQDQQGKILEVNQEAVRLLGYSREELLTMDQDAIGPAHAEPFGQESSDWEEGRKDLILETEYLTRDGKRIPAEVSSRIIKYNDREVILNIARDISERKQVQRALETSEERYRLLAETTQDLICIHNMAGEITYLNHAALDFTGYSREDAYQRHIREFVPPEEVNAMRKRRMNRTAGQDQRVRYQTRFLNQRGSAVPVEVSSAPILKDGQPAEILLIARDITKRVKAEKMVREYSEQLEQLVQDRTEALQQAREELFQKEKMAVLGQMAGSVSHELRNPLAVMSNAVYYLQLAEPEPAPKVEEYLGILEDEIDQAAKIVADLLDFSRIRPPEQQSVSLEHMVHQVRAELNLPGRVRWQVEIPPDFPPVQVDPGHLKQILLNLFTNASQAMPGGGELNVSAFKQDGGLEIRIQDTGTGIAPEHQGKIFEPLFTTKERGIGLGLAISKRLVQVNQGTIDFESQEGEGTLFVVHLPVGEERV
jgi:PAS domain S-box-containing protein